MKRFVASLSIALAAACLLSTNVCAFSSTDYVSRTSWKEQSYSSGNTYVFNKYDYGTFLPNDDAWLEAISKGSSSNSTKLYYKPYGSGSFQTVYGQTTSGSTESKVNVNPTGVDYLQKDSYAKATTTTGYIKLIVID